MPRATDLALLVLIAGALPVYDTFVESPRLRAAISAGKPKARLHGYQVILGGEWLATLVIGVQWVAAHRAWAELGLTTPNSLGFGIGTGAIIGVTALLLMQTRTVARLTPEKRAAVLSRFQGEGVGFLLPRTPQENRWFVALSVTAGICEEVIYRGFVVWALHPWLGLWPAAAVSVVLFGLAHSYQGRRGAINATAVGAVLGLLAIVAHSIVPGMILHAIIDIGSGATGYAIFREQPSRPDVAPAA